ncbi:hypothetical protein PCK1_001633 [Pneumocystis canis]|nr:hypothetical protein PCK1_001633 [Pneumocystis canis]
MDCQNQLFLEEKAGNSDKNDRTNDKVEVKANVPDGGFESWLQVFSSHLIIMISWGVLNSYGVFQTYYKTTLLKTSSISKLSLIGTMLGFIIILTGFFASPAYDRGHTRFLVISGSILIVLGMFLSSMAKQYYQIFICHSICIGVGSGSIFIPALGILAKYFDKKLSIAVGIAGAGAGVGGLLFPLFFQSLIDRIGFAWTMRAFSLVSAIFLLISIIIMEVYRIPHRQTSPFSFSSLSEHKYVIFNLATFFIFAGVYFPYFYIPIYGKSFSSTDFSAYYVSTINLASIFGRIIPSFIADMKGPLNIFTISSVVLVVLTYAWIGIHNVVGLFIFSVFYGFFAGAIMSLSAPIIAKLSLNLDYIGTQLAVSYGFSGIGFLIGTSLVGLIISRSNDTFFWAQIFSATLMLIGTLGLFLIIFLIYSRNLPFKISMSLSPRFCRL